MSKQSIICKKLLSLLDHTRERQPDYPGRQARWRGDARDRILASRMGIAAIQALLEDQRNIMVGLQDDEIVYVPLSKAIKQKKDINAEKWAAMQILSI